jgi:DNA-binding transcriptional regulator YiaG
MENDIIRFEKYVSKQDCWIWTGGKDIKGYGIFFYNKKTSFAHRIALVLYKNITLTNGLQVAHSCNNKSCVNPDHLRETTIKDNAKDKIAHGTALRGERCHFAKLNKEKVKEIRASLKSSKELATVYNVSNQTIRSIILNKSWLMQ